MSSRKHCPALDTGVKWPYKCAMADQPAYRVLAQELRTEVLQGKYPAGVPLPTEAELVESHGLSRQTVRRAFQELVAEGMVTRVAGRGTFAADSERKYLRQFGSIEELMGLAQDTDLLLLDPLAPRVDVASAGRLRSDTDAIYSITFLRTHEGRPFCLTECVFPQDVGRLLVDVPELTTPGIRGQTTVIAELEPRLTNPIAEADQSITAVAATPEIADALGCSVGAPLLRIDRIYADTTGRPVELAVTYFLPEHYSYRVKLARNVR